MLSTNCEQIDKDSQRTIQLQHDNRQTIVLKELTNS